MMEKRAGKIINICSIMTELGRETVLLTLLLKVV
jgi:short-subunit dehydrogenase